MVWTRFPVRWISAALLLCTVTACKFGERNVVFVTRTGFALDADTTPPTLDVGLIRQEGLVAPVFEGDQVLPVLTTLGLKSKGLGVKANHSFATGDAAVVMAAQLVDPTRYTFGQPGDVTKVPQPRMDGRIVVPKGSPRKPYFFATDTIIGLKVAWSTAAVPTSVSIGYKRKELAYIPLLEKDTAVYIHAPSKQVHPKSYITMLAAEGAAMAPSGQIYTGDVARPADAVLIQTLITNGALALSESGYEEIRVASLIATAHGGAQGAKQETAGVSLGTTFATGTAATLLASHPEIRMVLGPSLIPNFKKVVALRLGRGNVQANLAVLTAIYSSLEGFADAGDTEAGRLLERLNAVAKTMELPDFTHYVSDEGSRNVLRTEDYTLAEDWGRLTNYLALVNESVMVLKAAGLPDNASVMLNEQATDPAKRQELARHLREQTSLRKQIQTAVSTNDTLIEAMQYVFKSMSAN